MQWSQSPSEWAAQLSWEVHIGRLWLRKLDWEVGASSCSVMKTFSLRNTQLRGCLRKMIVLLAWGTVWRPKMGTQCSSGNKNNNLVHFYSTWPVSEVLPHLSHLIQVREVGLRECHAFLGKTRTQILRCDSKAGSKDVSQFTSPHCSVRGSKLWTEVVVVGKRRKGWL